MNIIAHAIRRCKQRGIPEYMLQLIMEMGSGEIRPGNAALFTIGKKEADNIIHELKAMIQQFDKLKRTKVGAVVADDEGAIITTYKIYG